MKTIIAAAVFTASAALFGSSAFANAFDPLFLSDSDVDAGVLCKVKDVTVLAASVDDCTRIGGEATHKVTTTKTPVK